MMWFWEGFGMWECFASGKAIQAEAKKKPLRAYDTEVNVYSFCLFLFSVSFNLFSISVHIHGSTAQCPVRESSERERDRERD